jgi:hypothetical protein
MQPRAAIVASDAMKRTTIAISKKVNVPRVNTFKAAAIAIKTGNQTSALQKRSALSVWPLFWEDRLRNVVSGS